MKPCRFKSESTAVGVFYTFNEILEAIIDDYAEVMSAARAVSLHKTPSGETNINGLSSSVPWSYVWLWRQDKQECQVLCPAPPPACDASFGRVP